MSKLYKSKPNPPFATYIDYKVPLYPCEVRVGIDWDNNMLDDDAEAKVESFGSCIYVTFNKKDTKNFSMIVHESYHVLESIGKYIEQTLTAETGAYLIQWIFDTICTGLDNAKTMKTKRLRK